MIGRRYLNKTLYKISLSTQKYVKITLYFSLNERNCRIKIVFESADFFQVPTNCKSIAKPSH